MRLSSGTRVGPYEVIDLLGAGGMGEVYRARDTKLGREVALKVLPDLFARDPERLARFQQEARLLAALNHPHIAAIYGLEEAVSGEPSGRAPAGEPTGPVRFLVLELVPGETLAERIARGALPADEALAVCRQIAEGLEAAHERGIIHRDLKPANVKVTPEGQVKVLDFGLAKAFAPREVSPGSADLMESPTLTAAGTQAGVILGTAAYMSPEQARGKPVDKRTDIWAFGCVLYECLTGRLAFTGETVSDTLAGILTREPDWGAVPGTTPRFVRAILRRCLEKDVRRRLRDIGDAHLEPERFSGDLAEPEAALVGRKPRWIRALPWCVAGLVAALAGVTWWHLKGPRAEAHLPVTRLAIHLPAGQHLAGSEPLPFAISDDGSQLAYVAQQGSRSQIFVRRLDSYDARPLAGTDRATFPFFSPDGRWLGFFSDRKLRKVLVTGGAPSTIADAPIGLGGTWGRGDNIVFTPSLSGGLALVQATGGEVKTLTRPNFKDLGYAHVYPQFLPDGRSFLFSIWGGKKAFTGTAVFSPESGKWRDVVPNGSGTLWAGSGHLVFSEPWDPSQLLAIGFDPPDLIAPGAPTPVLHGVSHIPDSAVSSVRVSRTGTLVYISGSDKERTLAWIGPAAQARPFWTDPGAYLSPRISPTGDRVAVSRDGAIWIVDIRRGSKTRLTQDATCSVWTPDGKEVTFASNRGGTWNMYTIAADGSGSDQLLIQQEYDQFPTSWSPDGRRLLFTQIHPDTGADIGQLIRDGKASALIATPFNEYAARFSPDGRWIAFASDESGKDEVYVQESSGRGAKWAISVDGGTMPVWSRDGRNIFYHNGDDLMTVSVEARAVPKFSAPRLVLSGPYEWDDFQKYYTSASYDIAPDGSTFLMIQRQGESAGTELRVVLNWFEELKRLVPAEKK